MKKKHFFTALLPTLLVAPALLAAQVSADETVNTENASSVEAVILHTNDVHGRIVEDRGVIGDAKLATVVEEERAKPQTTLVVDAGDAFQGLPISNSSKGEDRVRILNEIGYDAMAVGNHEFDFGLDEVKKYKEILEFPLLSANTYVDGARLFEASTIIDKNKDIEGDEFVVIGVTTPETATKTHPRNVEGVTFTEPIDEVNKVIAEIEARATAEGKTYKNYIVLAHLGVDTTTPEEWRGSTLAKALSENKALADKRIIVIDGHSHTVETATYGSNVTYNQTGSYLNNIGKITLKSGQLLAETSLISAADAKTIQPNEKVAKLVSDIKAKYDAENAVVVMDKSPVELNGDRENVRVRETNLGNVVADALYNYGQTGFSHPTDLAVTNGGGLRATVAKDKAVTKGDIIAVLPFGNIVSQITVTGQQISDMFTKSLGATLQENKETKQVVLDENGQPLLEANGGFLHISGAQVFYDTSLPVGQRVLEIAIYNRDKQEYELLDLQKTYYLATNDFLAAGGDGYTMLGGAREEGPSMDAVFADYLKEVDLSDYKDINPNSRLVSISKEKYDQLVEENQEQEETTQDEKDTSNQSDTHNSGSTNLIPPVKPSQDSVDKKAQDKKDDGDGKGMKPSSETPSKQTAEVSDTPSLTENTKKVPVTLSKRFVPQGTVTTQKSLPATGETSSVLSILLGVTLASIGFVGMKTRKEK